MDPAHDANFVSHYSRAYRDLFRYALMLTANEQDADDALQAASEVMWRKFDGFRQGEPFLPWARKVVYFEVLKVRSAKAKRHLLLSPEVIEQLAAEEEGEPEILAAQRRALAVCKAKLREKERRLIEGRYAGQKSVIELAQEAGTTANTLYNLLNRIRRKLLECTERELKAEGLL